MRRNSPDRNQPRGRRQQQQMIRYSVIDRQHGGMVVSTFAYPQGWQAASHVVWNMRHTNMPALVFASAFNPNGAEAFEFFPPQVFYWLENDLGLVPIGQNAHGLIRMPPRPAANALAELVIPHFRGHCQNLRVTGVQPGPHIWQIFNDTPPRQGESLVARVEYEDRRGAVEEEFYGTCDWAQVQGGVLNWGFGRLISFRAARGQLDRMRETFWQIAGSLQPTPQWQQHYAQTLQQLNGQFMGGINSYYTETLPDQQAAVRRNMAHNQHLRDQRDAQVAGSIQQTQRETQERSRYRYTPQEAFGDALMGRQAFHDPNNAAGNHQYVYGYPDQVWRNEQQAGDFYATNDRMDNPNRHQNGSWVEVAPIKPE